jgi:fumarate reductase subunit D
MGLNIDCVQWWAVMLAEFSLLVLLLSNSFIHYLFIYLHIYRPMYCFLHRLQGLCDIKCFSVSSYFFLGFLALFTWWEILSDISKYWCHLFIILV